MQPEVLTGAPNAYWSADENRPQQMHYLSNKLKVSSCFKKSLRHSLKVSQAEIEKWTNKLWVFRLPVEFSDSDRNIKHPSLFSKLKWSNLNVLPPSQYNRRLCLRCLVALLVCTSIIGTFPMSHCCLLHPLLQHFIMRDCWGTDF